MWQVHRQRYRRCSIVDDETSTISLTKSLRVAGPLRFVPSWRWRRRWRRLLLSPGGHCIKLSSIRHASVGNLPSNVVVEDSNDSFRQITGMPEILPYNILTIIIMDVCNMYLRSTVPEPTVSITLTVIYAVSF